MNIKRSRYPHSTSPARNRLARWSVFSTVIFTAVIGAVLSLSGCNGGKSGPLSGNPSGGNTGNSGPSVVNNFTVLPDRAAPGAIVKLQGVRLSATDVITIKFGDQETLIRNRDGDTAEVYVPPFLNDSNQHVAPAASVPVTVQVGTAAAKAATNQFTVLALPAAPGTTQAVVTRMDQISTFLGNFSEGILLPLAQESPPALDPVVANHGIVLAQAMQFLLTSPSNPDSLQAIINGTAPSLEGSQLPAPLLDSLMAQSEALGDVNAVAIGLFNIIQEVAPELLPANLATNRITTRTISGRLTGPDEGGARNAAQAIAMLQKDKYKALPNAKKIVLAIQFQRFLVSYEEGLANSGLFNDTTDKIAEVLGLVADKVKVGIVGGGAGAIVAAYTTAKITSKLARAFAGFLPNGVSKFYVRLKGTPYENGDPAYKMLVNQTVPLDFYVVTQWGGRKILDADDVLSSFDSIARKAGLDKVFEKYKVPKKKQEDIIKFLFNRTLITINAAYELRTGQPSPWLSATGAINAPPGKNPELKINDATADAVKFRVVTVSTASTNILRILNADAAKPNFFQLQSIDRGCNAGIRTALSYTPLATIVRESGGQVRAEVQTSIDVTNPDGSCPPPPGDNPTTCAGGAVSEYREDLCGSGGFLDCETRKCFYAS